METSAQQIVDAINTLCQKPLNYQALLDIAGASNTNILLATHNNYVADTAKSHGQLFNALRDYHHASDFSGAKFVGLTLNGATFDKMVLSDCEFINCRFSGVVSFHGADMTRVTLNAESSNNAKLICSHITGAQAVFSGNLSTSSFTDADLTGATFTNAALRQTFFSRSTLDEVKFVDVVVTTSTTFERLASCKDFTMDRYTLACLGSNFGHLTEGNRMDMKIIHDVATLRSQFSGVWMFAHIVALIAFVFPYTWFVGTRLAMLGLSREDLSATNSITLLSALWGFILRGPDEWQSGAGVCLAVFGPFLFYMVYNLARLLLLWKTKTLETQEHVTGLPAKFSLTKIDRRRDYLWPVLFFITRWFFVFAALAAFYNLYNFLQIRIPL